MLTNITFGKYYARDSVVHKLNPLFKTISLIIMIIAIFFIVVVFIALNHSQKETYLEWGYIPSSEYYELRLAATTSEVANGTETVTLTDGEYVALFRFKNGEDFVHYYFYDEDDLQYSLKEYNLLQGYRITIK